jgi:hypothetical protein
LLLGGLYPVSAHRHLHHPANPHDHFYINPINHPDTHVYPGSGNAFTVDPHL